MSLETPAMGTSPRSWSEHSDSLRRLSSKSRASRWSRSGERVESSNHVEAAERDLRSALRQLVLAQREWRAASRASAPLGEPAEGVAQVTANSAEARS